MVVYSGGLDRQALREKYLAFFPARASNAEAVQEAVKRLVALGTSRSTLARWAIQAGYSKGYVRSLLCRIFCALGLRERGVGAGRKLSPDAVELMHHARQRYGGRFLKVLRAAWRAGKSRMTSPATYARSLPSSGLSPNQVPQLNYASANARTPAQRPAGRITRRNARTLTPTRTRLRRKPL